MAIPLIVAPLAGLLSLLAAVILRQSILRASPGEKKMTDISDAVREGAMAYMNRQYRTIAFVAVGIILIFLGVAFTRDTAADKALWLWSTAGFVVGALFSGFAGYFGMDISTKTNVRVANAAKGGLAPALRVAFNGGAVSGLAVAGLALLGVSGF